MERVERIEGIGKIGGFSEMIGGHKNKQTIKYTDNKGHKYVPYVQTNIQI